MSLPIDPLPAEERVSILTARLANLKSGRGEFRPSNRVMAIKECERCLAEAMADLGRMN